MTPLQFLALREELEARGAGMGRAAFSQMIRRMAAARLVRQMAEGRAFLSA
jgi:hypothetical protein